MASIINMPKQGLQMTEGILVNWLVEEGGTVIKDKPLFEMETDKLNITMDAAEGGTLLKILHGVGDVVSITKPIAIVGEPGEDISKLLAVLGAADVKTESAVPTQPAAEASVSTGKAESYPYDVAILGAGPGGYESAIRCSQLGLKVCLIEAGEIGGTCLNRGCIPTKAMLHSAEIYAEAKNAAEFGVNTGNVTFDFAKIMARKDDILNRQRNGIKGLEKSHGVEIINGFGVLTSQNTIDVAGKIVTAGKIILATGSSPARPPIPGMDGKNVMTSDEIFSLKSCPESIVIIGGGVIGIEFATFFADLDVKVTVVEMLPEILPGMDTEMKNLLAQILASKDVEIMTSAHVKGIESGKKVTVSYTKDGKDQTAEGSICLVCVGRRPMTRDIGLEAVGVKTERGFVEVDEHLLTNIPTIYAIGDITGKVQLAHVASAQGMIAAANCTGKSESMDYHIIPSCVYTSPELASVGLSAEKAKAEGRDVKVGTFKIAGNGKAMVLAASVGLIKIVSDAQTGEILGGQILSPRATDMISEIAAVMRSEGTIEELSATIHPHPTLSEIILEAAHDTYGISVHLPVKRKNDSIFF